MFNSNLSWHLYRARRFDEATVQARRTLELDPSYPSAHFVLGWCFLWKGDTVSAIDEFQKSNSLDPQTYFSAAVAYAHARAGDRTKAEQALRDLDDLAKQRYVSPNSRVMLHLALGQKDKALDWLEKAYDEQDGGCWVLKIEQAYDPLRSEPRFQALLKRVGFGP